METKPKPQHTPGPWYHQKRHIYKGLDTDPTLAFTVEHTTDTRDCTVVQCVANAVLHTSRGDATNTEAEANARLIASAPELLALLRQMALDEPSSRLVHWHGLINEAITKATGEA